MLDYHDRGHIFPNDTPKLRTENTHLRVSVSILKEDVTIYVIKNGEHCLRVFVSILKEDVKKDVMV